MAKNTVNNTHEEAGEHWTVADLNELRQAIVHGEQVLQDVRKLLVKLEMKKVYQNIDKIKTE